MRCFVTVGTTQFDALVKSALSEPSCAAVKALGVKEIVVQAGRGSYLPPGFEPQGTQLLHGLEVTIYTYKDNIQNDMREAQLIIGHAGAGTCLEALRLSKPFIAVINCDLMDDHQRELADRLSALGCIVATTPQDLPSTLAHFSLSALKPFVPCDMRKLASEINRIVGLKTPVAARR